MTKIVTIWWGNGQSHLLDALYKYGDKSLEISSIVSMSDDGRTTGRLMKKFHDALGMHLPPTGDLRRCLFMMSSSPDREIFQTCFEMQISTDTYISDLNIRDYFDSVGMDEYVIDRFKKYFHLTLPIHSSAQGHKVGNLLMANLYYNSDKNYDTMLSIMHEALEVQADIIPVTTSKAQIRAILWNGEMIETQDRISNVAEYSAGISDLELMDCSSDAIHHSKVEQVISEADYIVIGPGDLYTSIISNFIIGWVCEALQKSKAHVIYIWNSTNKWWETMWLSHLDCLNKIEMFLWKRIDSFVVNSYKPQLSEQQKKSFQENNSVKWWDYLFLSQREKSELTRRNITLYEAPLLDEMSLYKHDKHNIVTLLHSIIL